ncbi:hypothetical protein PHYSODRAFT_310116 [Phytophthora sojae]|uniref:Uncharacterized protein n=1 Tax=Phytophthora sojae (strain P6497) TaxID=1094619 RepID=G4YN85_PHYSP|nr:hypothetical protein PHYSODRAFT_310116 [Phytophthora sojae]EGZ30038.1 hypothetical protein PHYSODRAFT_310116 [Phytophthora sojae]|eukprot:XP_009517313.1 hypothetical protein PHYSODRAFT_310116 [Phytophthora sojae]
MSCDNAYSTTRTDLNQDGVADLVQADIITPLSTNETIRQATVIVLLNYTLKYPYADSPIANLTTNGISQELLVQSIISEYRARNYTAELHAPNPIWTSSTNSSQATTDFRVQLNIRIDPVNVVYAPEWPEIVKNVWIQYYCIFVVVSTLTIALREYLFTNKEELDLDDLLDDALDDFADEVSAAQASEISSVKQQAAATAAATQSDEDNKMQENVAKFLEDAQNPEFQKVLEQAFRELGTDADGDNIEQLLGSLKMDSTSDETDDVNAGVAKTLQNMAKAAEDMEGVGTAQVEAMGEEMMAEMMKKFEEMGEKNDFQDLVDGMMQQLLSKDVMYDPMKQICERVRNGARLYPEWLAEKESLLSKEDYERYGKQYQYFQQIVAVYESEPDNFARLSELMQEVQETGQPPSEIVNDLAPGLQFDDEGMPIMPNMGPGMFPGMAGMPGMPRECNARRLMQHLDAISLGVFSYLQAHERVSRVESKPFVGATQVEFGIWEQKAPQIWFRDLRGKWSFLAETFTNYYRMMLAHLGIISWQPWLHLFIPNRMLLDEQSAQQQGGPEDQQQ